jgi:hypothetical protein
VGRLLEVMRVDGVEEREVAVEVTQVDPRGHGVIVGVAGALEDAREIFEAGLGPRYRSAGLCQLIEVEV